MKSFETTITKQDIHKVTELLELGDIGFGSNVKVFEDRFSEYSTKKYNIGLNSASAAAYCLFAYLYDKHGSCDVYTPSLGFTSISWAAEKNGHRIIFVDVDDNLLFDFNSYEEQKENTTRKKVLLPVLYGGVSNIPNFNKQVTDEIVVVDSAHCIQPTIKSNYIFFSFHPIKPLTMSCGGLLGTDDEEANEYICSYRNFGRENVGDTYDIVNSGFNFYMNNLNATLGLSQLDSCFKNIEKINKLYDEGYHIKYWTARGTVSKVDYYELTKSQLNKWEAKHHELSVGEKPDYHLLICDRTKRIEEI